MNDVTFIVVRLVVVIAVAVVTRYLVPVLKSFIDNSTESGLDDIIAIAVYAAQQTITDNREKKAYVLDQVSAWLTKAGLSIEPKQLDMLIEAAVYTMKQEAKHG